MHRALHRFFLNPYTYFGNLRYFIFTPFPTLLHLIYSPSPTSILINSAPNDVPPLGEDALQVWGGRHVLFVIWRPHRLTQVPSSRVSDVPTGTCLQASPLPPQTHSDCSLLIPQPPRVPAGLPQPSDRVLEAWDDQTRPRPLQAQMVRAAAQPPPPTFFLNSDHIPVTPPPPPATEMPHMPVFAAISGFRFLDLQLPGWKGG
jgi:hypothetical protein